MCTARILSACSSQALRGKAGRTRTSSVEISPKVCDLLFFMQKKHTGHVGFAADADRSLEMLHSKKRFVQSEKFCHVHQVHGVLFE